MLKVILVPGNGGETTLQGWLPYVKTELEKVGVTVIARDFPDSILARSCYWIPFLHDELKADKDTIIVGHSSGAVCAMRFAEQFPLLGSVLVGACYTDLGLENERISGYYDTPWEWEKIKNNQQWIVQFASTDDPWIPIHEARHIHKHLNTEYTEFTSRGHFIGKDENGREEFKECVDAIKSKL